MTVFTGTPTAAALTTLLTLEAKSTSPVRSPFVAMSEDMTTSLASMPSSLKYPRYFANNNGAADISLGEERENTAGFRVWPKASWSQRASGVSMSSSSAKMRRRLVFLVRARFMKFLLSLGFDVAALFTGVKSRCRCALDWDSHSALEGRQDSTKIVLSLATT